MRVAAAGQQEGKVTEEKENKERKTNGGGEDSRLSTAPPTQPRVGEFTFTSSEGGFAAQMPKPRGRATPDILTQPRTI